MQPRERHYQGKKRCLRARGAGQKVTWFRKLSKNPFICFWVLESIFSLFGVSHPSLCLVSQNQPRASPNFHYRQGKITAPVKSTETLPSTNTEPKIHPQTNNFTHLSLVSIGREDLLKIVNIWEWASKNESKENRKPQGQLLCTRHHVLRADGDDFSSAVNKECFTAFRINIMYVTSN